MFVCIWFCFGSVLSRLLNVKTIRPEHTKAESISQSIGHDDGGNFFNQKELTTMATQHRDGANVTIVQQ